jgi:hypothetical protein
MQNKKRVAIRRRPMGCGDFSPRDPVADEIHILRKREIRFALLFSVVAAETFSGYFVYLGAVQDTVR